MKASDKQEQHGHPRFYEILKSLATLHSEKNHDYAAGGNPLGNFMRRADLYSKYPGLDLSNPAVVAIIDSMKQLDAALWFLSNKHEAKVEGVADRLKDVAVYSILAMVLLEEKAKDPEAPEVSEGWWTSQIEKNMRKAEDTLRNPGLPKLSWCTCGYEQPFMNWGNGYYWIECPHCHASGEKFMTQPAAQKSWNEGRGK